MSSNASGKKRPASPPVDETKDLFDVEISDEMHAKLEAFNKEVLRAELINELAALKRLTPLYKKRREVIKTLPKFWPVALMNHAQVAQLVQHADDQKALVALEDIWVERHEDEPRTFTLEFHFGDNAYFNDRLLKKEYKYVPPPAAKDEKPDEDGITESMLDFDFERDVAPQKIEINWKSDAVKLTKLLPLVTEDEGEISDLGSFFNFFEQAGDPFDLGNLIANEIFPEAIALYQGKYEMELTDDEDSEEEEDEDGDEAEEIDLEKPEPKKQRKH